MLLLLCFKYVELLLGTKACNALMIIEFKIYHTLVQNNEQNLFLTSLLLFLSLSRINVIILLFLNQIQMILLALYEPRS